MTMKKFHRQFWTVLGTVNVVALIYAVSLARHADGDAENLLSAVALMGFMFLLLVLDAVSVVVADVIAETRR